MIYFIKISPYFGFKIRNSENMQRLCNIIIENHSKYKIPPKYEPKMSLINQHINIYN